MLDADHVEQEELILDAVDKFLAREVAPYVHKLEAADEYPDDIVEDIVQERLNQHDWNFGFILDGFPRNHEQARFFLESYDVDAVIYIDVKDDVVVERALARRKCSQCGLDYNLIYHRPETRGICDVCGGELVARADDNEEALRQRLADFHENTQPTLDLFDNKELVIRVDGTGAIDVVQNAIREPLKLKLYEPEPEPQAV